MTNLSLFILHAVGFTIGLIGAIVATSRGDLLFTILFCLYAIGCAVVTALTGVNLDWR